MEQLAPKSNIEWRYFGKVDRGVFQDFPKGMQEWAMLRSHLAHYGLQPSGTCVEIGCGAGRLTNALAADFDIVHALDVSAERLAQTATIPNQHKCKLHLVEGPSIPLPSNTCQLCISTHVFQHIAELEAIESYFREIYRVLNIEGCLLMHVPVIGAHGMTGDVAEVVRRKMKEGVKAVGLPLIRFLLRYGVRLPWTFDQYHVFSFTRLVSLLEHIGFHRVELRILPWGGYHGYVFATKQAALISSER